jgi:hypothetical protein
MRRFLTLVSLLCLALPAGISITGCVRNPAGNYCNGLGYGLKDTDVASIILQPQIAGISLAFGQTTQVEEPFAYNCKGSGASAPSGGYAYGTTNNQLVDISPAGIICAGTWNRNTGGGIANYTYCNPPNPLPSTNGLPYGVAYITATASSTTSNPVEVYVHAPVTSITLVGPQQCLSQGDQAQLAAQACYSQNGHQVLMCAPASVTTSGSLNPACPPPTGVPLSSIPACTSAIGALGFSVVNSTIASIDSTTNQITAEQPGTTAITASVAHTSASAGYFSTCPPASIHVTLANGNTSGTVTQGVTQNLTTTVYDTNTEECPPLGCPITGLDLTYQSTSPIDIQAQSGGSIRTSSPGMASINAICQPASCNPSPISEVGFNGTGLSLSSNPVTITTPGTASNYAWFASPGNSQYFVPIELLTGTVGSNVRLPYVPNSMVMDANGANLYFGSSHELMIYSTATNSLTREDTSVPGVVLAASPSGSTLLINDQARHLFYLYNVAFGTSTTFSGMGSAAAWTPDSQTLYIADNLDLNTPASCVPNPDSAPLITGHTNTLYVYNTNTGWSTYPLPYADTLPPSAQPSCTTPPNVALSTSVQTPTVTIPGVGVYLPGTSTVAHTWCPSGTVGDASSIAFYPVGDSEPVQTDALTATTDGQHILGAALDGGNIQLTDIGVSIPTTACSVTTTGSGDSEVQTMNPLDIGHPTPAYNQLLATQVSNVSMVDQVVPSPVSSLAFVTYTGANTGASLPYYFPGSNGAPGTLGYVTLTGSGNIASPLVGAFSPDGSIFFVSTAGDNMIHYISVPTNVSPSAPPIDKQQISPNLPACDPATDLGCTYTGAGTIVPVTAIAIKPRSTT